MQSIIMMQDFLKSLKKLLKKRKKCILVYVSQIIFLAHDKSEGFLKLEFATIVNLISSKKPEYTQVLAGNII